MSYPKENTSSSDESSDDEKIAAEQEDLKKQIVLLREAILSLRELLKTKPIEEVKELSKILKEKK